MLLKPALAAALLATAFAASSCGKSSKSSDDSWIVDSLDGRWVIGCQATTYYPGATHVIKSLTLSGGGYLYVQDAYSDASCGSLVLNITETGTYDVIGGKASSPIRDINFAQSSFTAITYNAAVTNTLNTTGSTTNAAGTTIPEVCVRLVPTDTDLDPSSPLVPDPVGEPFTQNVAKDISGLNCGAGHVNPSNGSTVVGIYSYSESSSSKLVLGSPSSAQLGVLVVGKIGTTVRPSTLDATMSFARQ